MAVISGKHAYIEFYKEEDFRRFGCAQSVMFEGEMEVANVTTIGDGIFNKFRGQSLTWSITLGGLIVYDDASLVSPFDLLEYWRQMVDISFQIIFERDDNSIITAISGNALVVKPSVGGDTTFGRSAFTLQGNGEPVIGIPPTCDKRITNYTVTRVGLTFVYSVNIIALNAGSVGRYDWRVDGGAVNTQFTNSWSVNLVTSSSFLYGSHVLEIWPVCDNGARGDKLTRNFIVPFGF